MTVLNVISACIAWAFAWALALLLYLRLFEARRGYPSQIHRRVLIVVGGPVIWLLAAWELPQPSPPSTSKEEASK